MHACLELGRAKPMGSDAPPGAFSVQVSTGSVVEAERVFAAPAEGGEVTMPLGRTFWNESFGMPTDGFGVPWMIGCEPSAQGTGASA